MTVDPELLELMQTPVSIERFTGVDGFGNNTYATAMGYTCRVENFKRSTNVGTSKHGSAVAAIEASCELIMDYIDPPFGVKDRVTLATRPTMEVTEVTIVDDENGPYYQSLACSNNQEGSPS